MLHGNLVLYPDFIVDAVLFLNHEQFYCLLSIHISHRIIYQQNHNYHNYNNYDNYHNYHKYYFRFIFILCLIDCHSWLSKECAEKKRRS